MRHARARPRASYVRYQTENSEGNDLHELSSRIRNGKAAPLAACTRTRISPAKSTAQAALRAQRSTSLPVCSLRPQTPCPKLVSTPRRPQTRQQNARTRVRSLSPAPNDGPAGKRPKESSSKETDEATFAKQLSNELYRRAHSGDFAALVLIADPQTLGQIRQTMHKEVQDRLVAAIGKTLTNASVAEIPDALN